MKSAFSILFFLTISISYSRSGSTRIDNNPFSFYTSKKNEVRNGITDEEHALIKQYRIRKIKVELGRDQKYRDYGIYLFNEKFNLKSYTVFSQTKKDKFIIGRESYAYNEKNLLISVTNEFVGNYINYDSIVYDNQGLITSEFHSSKTWAKKNGYVENEKLEERRVMYQKLDDYYILSNSREKDSVKWKEYYDYQNNYLKGLYLDRIDSVSRYSDNIGSEQERYWYKYATDSVFRLGLTRQFDNGLLIKETQFQTLTYNLPNVVIKHYIYNSLSQLALTYVSESHYNNIISNKVLYFYNDKGFLHKKYLIDGSVNEQSYSYHTSPRH